MRFTNQGAFLQFDKWDDYIFPIGYGGGIENELTNTFFQGGISMDRLWDDENIRLDGAETLWVWAHGNRHRNIIAAGPEETYTPVSLAARLSKSLHKASNGHIIVWSCYAGAPDGFVEHFAAAMQRLGYRALHFWGCTGITGSMQRSADGNQWADVYAENSTLSSAGDLATSRPTSSYGMSRARRNCMRGYGPGLQAAFTRAYDF